MKGILKICMIVALLLADGLPVFAAPQVDLDEGTFFEAEDYDKLLHGDGFAEKTAEQLASNGQVLTGMFKPGAVSYRLTVPADGDYVVWLRCAVPADTQLKLGVNAADDEKLLSLPVARTTEDLEAANAYQWQRLAQIHLKQGENVLVLGQGAQRPDCFFLARRPDFDLSPRPRPLGPRP